MNMLIVAEVLQAGVKQMENKKSENLILPRFY